MRNFPSMLYRVRLFSFFLGVLLSTSTLSAQQQLARISSTPRSDGKGFVIRFHGMAAPDSFRVYQSSSDLIQVAYYHAAADTSGVLLPVNRPEIKSVTISPIGGGIGVSIFLAPGQSLLATSYLDANKKDLLLPLTKMPESDVARVLKGLEPIDWKALAPKSQPEEKPSSPVVETPKPVTKQAEPKSSKDAAYQKLKNRQLLDVIVIDAGHGGKDPGAIGRFAREKDVTLGVALKLGNLIKKEMPYAKVVYTRDTDTFIPLDERGHIANKHEGDLFISVHCNSVENRKNSPKGASFYFLGMHRSDDAYRVMLRENAVVRLEEGKSKTAELSEEQLLLYELTNRGYMESSQNFSILLDQAFTGQAKRKSGGIRQAGFMVLYYSSMPAVLIELGFISNQEEEKYLASEAGQEELARAVFKSVLSYRDLLEGNRNNAN
jgi:N-acetylmuramoyl-L-alanine amidase